MENKTYALNENQVKTILATFEGLRELRYSELNKIIGSLTIEEMFDLYRALRNWYYTEVLNYFWDDELGWCGPGEG